MSPWRAYAKSTLLAALLCGLMLAATGDWGPLL
jgi:hypothetical protein